MSIRASSNLFNAASKMTVFDIQITSDVVCPWCYIGHTRLSRAIASHQKTNPQDKFNLNYIPYYLNPPSPPMTATTTQSHPPPPPPPSFPVQSTLRKEAYSKKFGPNRAEEIFGMLEKVAASEGLHFKSGGKTGSSRNGHRLIRYAQSHGGEKAQNDTMLGLWKRYYEQEVDITRLEVLMEAGVEAGLGTAEEIKRYLESNEGGIEVDQLAEEQRLNGITGVPHYVFQNRFQVSGGQDSSVFESIFRKVKDVQAKEDKVEKM